MAKDTLDLTSEAPISFDAQVDIPTPDGNAKRITITYKWRDRIQMAALFDSYLAAARKEEPAAERPLAEAVKATIESDVEAIFDVATGWKLGADFDAQNLRKLCTRYPGAASAILGHYRDALTRGRLGN